MNENDLSFWRFWRSEKSVGIAGNIAQSLKELNTNG